MDGLSSGLASRSPLYVLLPEGVAGFRGDFFNFKSCKKTPQRSIQNLGFYFIPDVAKISHCVS